MARKEIDLIALKNRYGIVGTDPAFEEALRLAVRVAPTDFPVLIIGETGAGKENIARIIHDYSNRRRAVYQTIDCGSTPEGTIESELFGHKKGSFTDAVADRVGLFESANGGTLFLDELGNMPLKVQVRLLRVLETGAYVRVGDSEERHTDVRVVAATNADLMSMMHSGRFRPDLYYRLNTITIYLPSLRERRDDIYPLFVRFAQATAERYGIERISLTEEAEKLLVNFPWPGNVRQLKNFTEKLSFMEMERAVSAEVMQKYLDMESRPVHPVALYTAGSEERQQYNQDSLLQQVQKLQVEVTNLKQIVYELIIHSQQAAKPQEGYASAPRRDQPLQLPSPEDVTPVRVVDSEPVDVTHEEVGAEDETLDAKKRRAIIDALKKHEGSRKKTAEELGISERTLYRKIRDYGLDNM
jgi:DNA-binding NtrC family response regulator